MIYFSVLYNSKGHLGPAGALRGGVRVAEQGREYDQYAPQANGNGRLFNNSMFGFNKEEVLEYLEELTEENFRRQSAADARIQELTGQLQKLEAAPRPQPQQPQQPGAAVPNEELEAMRRKLASLTSEMDVAKTASQQAEGELGEFKERLFTAQRENDWLREEYQKSDKQIAELRRQLDEASEGQWHGAEEQIAELRRQVAEVEAERDAAEAERDAAEAERDAAEAERDAYLESLQMGAMPDNSPAAQAAGYIIDEANEEADRIRAGAIADRDRIHRQIVASATGLAGSITTLREDISSVEGDVSTVLEAVQDALGDLMSALGRTEQNLTTLGIAAERFPAAAPAVPLPKQQQVVYFQPSAQLEQEEPLAVPEKPRQRTGTPKAAAPAQSIGSSSGFRRVWPDTQPAGGNTRPFRPTYSNSPTAKGAYFPQTAEVLPTEAETREERARQLSETLVDTLMQLMN